MTHDPSSSELMVRLLLRSDRGSADLKGEGINPESELVLDRLLVCEVVALVKGSTSYFFLQKFVFVKSANQRFAAVMSDRLKVARHNLFKLCQTTTAL